MSLRSEIDTAIAEELSRALSQGQHHKYLSETSEHLSVQVARVCGVSRCLLFSSATAALETVLRTVIKAPTDQVLMSGYDYPGNFWAVERAGARPVLVDVQQDSWCLEPQHVEAALASNSNIRAVIASYLHGEAPDLGRLRDLCDPKGVLLIEDACQCFGGEIQRFGGEVQRLGGETQRSEPSRPTGSTGHVGLVSFGGGKSVSAGRGGGLVTSDEGIAQRVTVASGAGSGPYALSELQAAVVLAQLPFVSRLNQVVQDYFVQTVEDMCVDRRPTIPWMHSDDLQLGFVGKAFYQAGLLLNSAEQVETSVERLRGMGVPCGRGFAGFHRRSHRRCDRFSELPNTRIVSERTLTIHHSVAFSQLSATDLSETLLGLVE